MIRSVRGGKDTREFVHASGARLPVSGCRASGPRTPCAAAAVAALSVSAFTISVLSATALWLLVDSRPAAAQQLPSFLNFNFQVRPKPTGNSIKSRPDPGAWMRVQADEIRYDYSNLQVSAVGSVRIHYNGGTVEAGKVVYDQKTKRLHAVGNARLTQADGKVSYGQELDLSDDYRDGFIDSLRLEQTRVAAVRADRTDANYTEFHCNLGTPPDNSQKPPLWQVKAARIIHSESEKMIYFEDATVEFSAPAPP
jgi:LPS-assembly protein